MGSTCWLLISLSVVGSSLAQYYQQSSGPRESLQPQERYQREPLHTQPPPQIISHKQAQNHDGNFKYAFAAENGLSQGEYIAADGSRNGGYTYVDPSGKKISVKYTAGKEGFRIIEGDHIPRAPPQAAQAPHPGYAQPQVAYQQPRAYDDGQYRPEQYNAPAAPSPAYQPSYTQPQLRFPAAIQRSEANNLDETQPEYHDEPGKAHSFGAGYAFEFGG